MKKKLQQPYIIGKIFNNKEYANNFLSGKLYINPLASFGIKKIWDFN